jgi:hypothetical protein
MNVATVMDEVAAALRTIPDWSVYEWPNGSATPPAAIVLYPDEVMFDETYQRGSDRITMPVVVLAGTADDLSTRDRLAAWMDGGGPRSVKRALEAATYAGADYVRVVRCEPGPYQAAGRTYLAAVFELDIMGAGE